MFLTWCFGLTFTTYLFFPGYGSTDTFVQLKEARTLVFDGIHPPLMAFLWHFMDHQVPGPLGMLVFHGGMYWTGWLLIVSRLFGQYIWSPILLAVIGFFPPNFAIVSTVWKDVGLGASLLLGFGLLLVAEQSKKRMFVLLSQPLFFYGLCVRHNAAPAIFPLEFWAVTLFTSTSPRLQFRKLWTRILITFVLFAMFLVGNWSVTKALVKEQAPNPIAMILYHDLLGISVIENQVLLPQFAFPEGESSVAVSDMKAVYTPSSYIEMIYRNLGGKPGRRLRTPWEPKYVPPLLSAWKNSVIHHFPAYLKHRSQVFSESILGWRQGLVFAFMTNSQENDLGVSTQQGKLAKKVMAKFWQYSQNWVFFRGAVYIFILVTVLTYSWLSRRKNIPTSLWVAGASASFYLAPYYFTSVDSDFRYIWWSVLATFSMLLCLLSSALTETRSDRSKELLGFAIWETDLRNFRNTRPITKGPLAAILILIPLCLTASIYLLLQKILQLLAKGYMSERASS